MRGQRVRCQEFRHLYIRSECAVHRAVAWPSNSSVPSREGNRADSNGRVSTALRRKCWVGAEIGESQAIRTETRDGHGEPASRDESSFGGDHAMRTIVAAMLLCFASVLLADPSPRPCLYKGVLYPHGTKIGTLTCVDGTWR